ncbi:MAG: hypothetical protein HY331_11180 [Chloroflexi bacterium]|nr:hypothetical protein [Chloroflexota bacterium]
MADHRPMPEDAARYMRRLADALRHRDVAVFRRFLAESGRAWPLDLMTDEDRLRAVMHRMILTHPDLTELHAESERWLLERRLDLPPGYRRARSLNGQGKTVPSDCPGPPPRDPER